MKEYEVLHSILQGYGNRYSKALEAVVTALNNRYFDILDLEAVKRRVAEAMEALEIKMRFDILNCKVNDKLICNNTDFELNGHKLDSLDEVEKAINNKAFL